MSVLDFMEEKPKRKSKKQTVEVEVVKEQKPKRKKQSVEVDIEMKKFKCVSCGKEHFDMSLYFYDKPSTKCLWCTKFPKKEKKK
ncbi:MAG: hypothetical protein EBU90_26775 [Proteobacteria bacterium]|nr:hypothetical protein [Pseudomonadota bacterium]